MKKFEINGTKYTFNSLKFIECFKNYINKHKNDEKKIKVDDVEQSIADSIHVQKGTVHSWKFSVSGPTDIEMIKNIANYFEIEKYTYLLREEISMTKLTDLQLQSAKRIYDAFVGFLHEFDNTGGFTTTLWYEFLDKGSKDPVSDMYDYIKKIEDKISLIIREEYFYLHDLPIYNEFINFLDEDLINTYDGKLDYAYRFEAYAEGNPTTQEDYDEAMDKLNSIIEKYN